MQRNATYSIITYVKIYKKSQKLLTIDAAIYAKSYWRKKAT